MYPAKGKICRKCRKANYFAKLYKSSDINVANYEDDNTLEFINSCDICALRQVYQIPKFNYKSS